MEAGLQRAATAQFVGVRSPSGVRSTVCSERLDYRLATLSIWKNQNFHSPRTKNRDHFNQDDVRPRRRRLMHRLYSGHYLPPASGDPLSEHEHRRRVACDDAPVAGTAVRRGPRAGPQVVGTARRSDRSPSGSEGNRRDVPIRPHDGGVRQQHPDGSLPGQLPDDRDRPRFRVQTRGTLQLPGQDPSVQPLAHDPERLRAESREVRRLDRDARRNLGLKMPPGGRGRGVPTPGLRRSR